MQPQGLLLSAPGPCRLERLPEALLGGSIVLKLLPSSKSVLHAAIGGWLYGQRCITGYHRRMRGQSVCLQACAICLDSTSSQRRTA